MSTNQRVSDERLAAVIAKHKRDADAGYTMFSLLQVEQGSPVLVESVLLDLEDARAELARLRPVVSAAKALCDRDRNACIGGFDDAMERLHAAVDALEAGDA